CRNAEPLTARAGNVGGSDIAAARSADVFIAQDADEHVAERDRTEEIGERNGNEPGVHRQVECNKEGLGIREQEVERRGGEDSRRAWLPFLAFQRSRSPT